MPPRSASASPPWSASRCRTRPTTRTSPAGCATRLKDLTEIEDCWFIAGDDSYMLKVRVGDVDGLERTIRRLSGTKGVSRTRTTIVLSTKWENRVGELPEEAE